ncbi:MAG: N-6 DNA methylase [Chlorobiaceae bacterium]|nr:N-6 DNA methylase [Chlorobiaceae bacterium]NTV59863.1 N-6 DNA methylase [Chlorobiaceae bacterium]
MDFSSITIQGNIISTGILGRIREDEEKFQTPADFGLDRRDSVRDEIGMAWNAAKAHYTAFSIRAARLRENDSGTSETRNSWMIPLLRILGYDVEKAQAYVHPDTQKSYAISHQASNLDGFPIHIMGLNDDLDRRRESSGPRLGPHALVQEYLNNTEHTYALVTNGRYLRLLRDATRLVRLSYIEFNLEKMMDEELYADFALLFRVLHATRMPKSPDSVEDSPIEYYHQESLASGTRIREKLSKAVENSILELANGFLFHPRNTSLHQSIQQGILKASDFYADLLQLIYRILFLIVIEERNLVYPETGDEELQRFRRLYYDYYSIERLRRLAEKLHYVDGRKYDLWQGLKATFQLFENGFYGGKIGIKPLGSGIFSPAALREIPMLFLGNEALLKVIRLLTFFENDQQQQVRVNYSDLDVEEFGSVYEGLLEYDAEFSEINGRKLFRFTKGTGRGETGAHYTPEELVKPLIRYSLEYIIEDKLKETDREKALLSIRVCDVACGSGHILLSAARRIAVELSRVRTGEDQPSPTTMRHALRDVIRTCIYGVDKNPLAVNLCKVALWLEAHNPGEPLNFLDHHIKCGDAIVGLAHQDELFRGIADEAFKSLSGDDKQVASGLLKRNKAERKQREAETGSLGLQLMLDANQDVMKNMDRLLMQLRSFNNLPESTSEEIESKSKAYRELQNGTALHHLKLLADLQVMQFFLPKVVENREYFVTDKTYFGYLRGGQSVPYALEVQTIDQSLSHRFFHWFLEFPEVFVPQKENKAASGFDVILGNPPFLGGQKLSGTFGHSYLEYIKYEYAPIGAVDLVTYFFRRIYTLLRDKGFQSLISTNTIAQGSAREGGLDVIFSQGGFINHAVRSMKWPGIAAVEVALVTITKQMWTGKFVLAGKEVKTITPYLDDSDTQGNPYSLKQNEGKSFQGSIVLGKGFILELAEAEALIKKNPKNRDVLSPYLIGDDLNNNLDQSASRWVINFYNWPEEECRKKYPECFEIVERLVMPDRYRQKREIRKKLWWQFAEKASRLYRSISFLKRLIIRSLTSKHHSLAIIDTNFVIDQTCIVICFDDFQNYSILQSDIHYQWINKVGGDLGGTGRYNIGKGYETFPFPQNLSKSLEQQLEQIGEAYHEHRKQLMLAMQLGLTKTYNLFHTRQLRIMQPEEAQFDDKAFQKLLGKDAVALRKHLARTPGTITFNEAVAGIQKLRDLHIQMDNAVLEAYGWSDIDLRHDFYEVEYLPENDRIRFTIHPDARREILKRLLELNHKIHAQEVADGLWDKKGNNRLISNPEKENKQLGLEL